MKQLRLARTMEVKAFDSQLRGIMAQARAVADQRRSALMALAGLQRVELAVAMTKNHNLHDFLDDTAGHLIRKMPRGDPANVREAMDTLTERAEGMAASFGVEAAPSTIRDIKAKFQGCTEVVPIVTGTHSLAYPPPRQYRADGSFEEYGAMAMKGSTYKKLCPFAHCDHQGTRATIMGHIREKHTQESLVCPNLEDCRAKPPPYRSFSQEMMSKHFRLEGAIHTLAVQAAVNYSTETKKRSLKQRSRGSSPAASASSSETSTTVKQEPWR